MRLCLLCRDCASDRVDDARKFHQQAVAGALDDAAVVLGDLGVDELAPQRLEAFERAFLVHPNSREYPATSAARIAARRRVWLMEPRQQPSAGPTKKAPAAQDSG